MIEESTENIWRNAHNRCNTNSDAATTGRTFDKIEYLTKSFHRTNPMDYAIPTAMRQPPPASTWWVRRVAGVVRWRMSGRGSWDRTTNWGLITTTVLMTEDTRWRSTRHQTCKPSPWRRTEALMLVSSIVRCKTRHWIGRHEWEEMFWKSNITHFTRFTNAEK